MTGISLTVLGHWHQNLLNKICSQHMGTLLEITLYHEPREAGKQVLAKCFQEARRLEEIFSAHDDDSDLNRLNRHADLGPVEINRELWSVLKIAVSLGRQTDGD